MSHEALPIDRARFAEALEALPLDALHSKVAELRNNMNHLRSSNEQMIPFADQGDQDCKDAMYENLIVMTRINERLELLRAEVEKRGMAWPEAEVDERQNSEPLVNGHSTVTAQTPPRSGRLTDDQLRAQLEARLAHDTSQHDQEEEEEEGLHL